MKILHPIAFLVFLTAISCRAAAPASVAGHVFYQTTPTIHGWFAEAHTLTADGKVVRLFSNSYLYPGPISVGYPGPGADGANSGPYSYRKLDELSAELSFSGLKYHLRFTADRSDLIGEATITDPPLVYPIGYFYRFRFAPLPATGPLVNCSNRSFVRPGGSAFAGFVVGDESRYVLVRAVGPGLAQFGVTDPLATPRLSISFNRAIIATNNGWTTSAVDALRNTSALVGAFPLAPTSADSAVIIAASPGAYVAEVSSGNPADSGQALVEVYLLP